MPKARSSTTCWMGTPSRSTPTTGEELWKTKVADLSRGETITMAPLVVKDRVFVGPSGGEFGMRGWFKGLDLATGKIVWTAQNFGPGQRDCWRSPAPSSHSTTRAPSSPRRAGPQRPGSTAARRCGAGFPTTPNSISSTTAPAIRPYNAEQRAGDNKWTSSVLARRPGDGSLVWAYQFTPHDNWDYDATPR